MDRLGIDLAVLGLIVFVLWLVVATVTGSFFGRMLKRRQPPASHARFREDVNGEMPTAWAAHLSEQAMRRERTIRRYERR